MQRFNVYARASQLLLASFLSIVTMPHAAMAAPSIVNIGQLSGATEIYSQSLSGNGTTVVGQAFLPSVGGRAFRWTAGSGVVDIGAGTLESTAGSVNRDGSVVVGSYSDNVSIARAYRWTAATGAQDLGLLPGGNVSIANGLSADGSIVVGAATTSTTFQSFRWTAATGMQQLPTAPGFDYSLGASATSADGSVIVGTNGRTTGGTNADRAYRYTVAGGYQNLGVQSGLTRSVGRGVSGDGNTVIGFSQLFPAPGNANVLGAFRWTASTGLVPLFFDDESYSVPNDVSFDGSKIVGTSTRNNGPRAVLWTSTLGNVDLNTYLPTLGLNLTGWTLTDAAGISDNGLTLAGTGTFNGQQAAWVVNLVPEPASAGLLIANIGLLLIRPRRSTPVAY